jgi:hypothetical protein
MRADRDSIARRAALREIHQLKCKLADSREAHRKTKEALQQAMSENVRLHTMVAYQSELLKKREEERA